MLAHRHLLPGDGQPGDIGGETGLVLVTPHDKLFVELDDAQPVPGGLHGAAGEQYVLRGQLHVTAIRSCADLYVIGQLHIWIKITRHH